MKNRKVAGAAVLAVVLSILLNKPRRLIARRTAVQQDRQRNKPRSRRRNRPGAGKRRIPGRAAQATVRAGTVFSLEAANINIRKQTMR